MSQFRSIADIRRDYGDLNLNESSISKDPISQFKRWFEEVLEKEQHDPTAMVLSTVDEKGYPDSRVVLLKGVEEGCFIFYTNYNSTKGVQILTHPYVALNFYWPHMARQVRVRGVVEKTTKELSDKYFLSRPINSQLGAIISPQSQQIKDRAFLEDALNQLILNHTQEPIVRPQHWGGYKVNPECIEFWQGRDNRLHDRVSYLRQKDEWSHCRLAP
jgi:pyridoxamine 5'-phosphate oxidase